MIIGACGFGSTGSSVVTDYLKEFDGISVKDDLEFTWVSATDGLIDLERAVMTPHNRTSDSMYAIIRFCELAERKQLAFQRRGLDPAAFQQSVDTFIDAITTTKWYWYDNRIEYKYKSKYFLQTFMKREVIPRLEKKKGHHVHCWPLQEMRISVMPENFYTAALQHVDEMLRGMGVDTDGVVALDQPFSGNNPQACFPFYKDPYAVVVDRDPRDNYVFSRTKLLGKFHNTPIDHVEDYIAYYRALRQNQPYLQSDPRILRLRFEDMVYEYEDTTKKLREFLHLPENPRPKSVFDPELSIANTQVFKRYPQFAEDIEKIEKALPEYLFDFSKYPEPDLSKNMFYGKSPLNDNFKRKFAE